MEYLRRIWIDPRLIASQSRIHGRGIFTTATIRVGEIVMIWGGIPIPKSEFNDIDYREHSAVPIDDDTYLGLRKDDVSESLDEYLNHSCDPNCWLIDEVTVVARRDIAAGEEITVDRATWDADEAWPYGNLEFDCLCGSANCRHQITCRDWMRADLQARYAGHFSPYIARLIATRSNI